jgi:hypothetical protein
MKTCKSMVALTVLAAGCVGSSASPLATPDSLARFEIEFLNERTALVTVCVPDADFEPTQINYTVSDQGRERFQSLGVFAAQDRWRMSRFYVHDWLATDSKMQIQASILLTRRVDQQTRLETYDVSSLMREFQSSPTQHEPKPDVRVCMRARESSTGRVHVND